MALKLYSDAGCTVEILSNQAFPGTGAQTAFPVTNFTGAQLGSVYLETPTTATGITFDTGIGSGFVGLTINALIGRRVIHNGVFRGTVVANTATTVTISDLTYTQATASSAIISTYTKETAITHYSVTGNTVNMVTAPTAAQILHLVPSSTLGMNFGGVAGTVKTTATSFYVMRTPGFTYDTLQVQAQDLSQTQASLTQTGITFAAGVGSGFSGLVAGALIGRAVNHNGLFRGTVTANTTTTVTISDGAYTQAVASDAVIYTIGSLDFAPDAAGSPGTYKDVIHPAAINNNTAVRIWVRDTVTVPSSAMNYPNNVIKVTGIEYLE